MDTTNDVESSFDITSLGNDLSRAEINRTIFSPVFVVGFSREELEQIRSIYGYYASSYDVHFYGFNIAKVSITERIGVVPQTIILNSGIEIEGVLRGYIRIHKIPVLRVLPKRCPLADLPRSDYYGGVYETIGKADLDNMELLTAGVDLGIRVYNRSRDNYVPMSEFVHQTLANLMYVHQQLQQKING